MLEIFISNFGSRNRLTLGPRAGGFNLLLLPRWKEDPDRKSQRGNISVTSSAENAGCLHMAMVPVV